MLKKFNLNIYDKMHIWLTVKIVDKSAIYRSILDCQQEIKVNSS